MALLKYEDTLERLRNWQPPLKLSFRKAPEMEGYLLRQSQAEPTEWRPKYFCLTEGRLLIYADDTKASLLDRMSLVGLGVSLLPKEKSGRDFSFKVLYGYDRMVLQAESHELMLEWACALYYGMAIANGGGYVLSLLILRTARNHSREEVEAAAIARSGSPVRRYSSSDFTDAEFDFEVTL